LKGPSLYLEHSDPAGEPGHVADELVALLDSMSDIALTRPEAGNGSIRLAKRFVLSGENKSRK